MFLVLYISLLTLGYAQELAVSEECSDDKLNECVGELMELQETRRVQLLIDINLCRTVSRTIACLESLADKCMPEPEDRVIGQLMIERLRETANVPYCTEEAKPALECLDDAEETQVITLNCAQEAQQKMNLLENTNHTEADKNCLATVAMFDCMASTVEAKCDTEASKSILSMASYALEMGGGYSEYCDITSANERSNRRKRQVEIGAEQPVKPTEIEPPEVPNGKEGTPSPHEELNAVEIAPTDQPNAEETEAQPDQPNAEEIEAESEQPNAEKIEAETEEPNAEEIEAEPDQPNAEEIEAEPEKSNAGGIDTEPEQPNAEEIDAEPEQPNGDEIEPEPEQPNTGEVEAAAHEPNTEDVEEAAPHEEPNAINEAPLEEPNVVNEAPQEQPNAPSDDEQTTKPEIMTEVETQNPEIIQPGSQIPEVIHQDETQEPAAIVEDDNQNQEAVTQAQTPKSEQTTQFEALEPEVVTEAETRKPDVTTETPTRNPEVVTQVGTRMPKLTTQSVRTTKQQDDSGSFLEELIPFDINDNPIIDFMKDVEDTIPSLDDFGFGKSSGGIFGGFGKKRSIVKRGSRLDRTAFVPSYEFGSQRFGKKTNDIRIKSKKRSII